MTDILALAPVERRLVTDQLVLNIAYDAENLTDPERRARYTGPIKTDSFGRQDPKDALGFIDLPRHISSAKASSTIGCSFLTVEPDLLVRKITIGANHILNENDVPEEVQEQQDLFADHEALEQQKAANDLQIDELCAGESRVLPSRNNRKGPSGGSSQALSLVLEQRRERPFFMQQRGSCKTFSIGEGKNSLFRRNPDTHCSAADLRRLVR